MQRYILARIIQAIITCLVVVTVVFILVRLTGDPAAILGGSTASEEMRQQISKDLGLDKPLFIQYVRYMRNMLKGDFGYSFTYRKPAIEVMFERMPVTLHLLVPSLLITLCFSIPLGVYTAVKKDSYVDIFSRLFSFLACLHRSFGLH